MRSNEDEDEVEVLLLLARNLDSLWWFYHIPLVQLYADPVSFKHGTSCSIGQPLF